MKLKKKKIGFLWSISFRTMLFSSYCRKKIFSSGCDKQEVIKNKKNNYLKEPKVFEYYKKK